MSGPFTDIIERDLAMKCSDDASSVLTRAFQLCDTQRGCVVVGIAGVAGAVAALVGAFYAAYPEELTEEIIDTFWRDLARGIVVETALKVSGPLSQARAAAAGKPVA